MNAMERSTIKACDGRPRMNAGAPERLIHKNVADAGHDVLAKEQRFYHAAATLESRRERIARKDSRIYAKRAEIRVFFQTFRTAVPNNPELPGINKAELLSPA